MEERNVCPYCGESIAKTAKKCRYCGEWLPQANDSVQQSECLPILSTTPAESGRSQSSESVDGAVNATVALKSVGSNNINVVKIIKSHTNLGLLEAKQLVDGVVMGGPCIIKKGVPMCDAEKLKKLLEDEGAEVSLVIEKGNATQPLVDIAQTPSIPIEPAVASQIAGHPQQTSQQPQIVVNVVSNQSVEQNVSQEQTMVVNQSNSSNKSAPVWIFLEMLGIGGFIWGFTGLWILGLIAFIGGSFLLMVPFLGAILCWALGIAWGIILGAIGYGIFDSEPAGWIIGIISAIGIGYGHYEARQKNIDELNQ